MEKHRFADVIVDISHEKLDRTFQYKIPQRFADVITIGSSVVVPFGKGSRLMDGYVAELTDSAEFPEEKMKEICRLSDKQISPSADMLQLAAWMKHTYGSTMIAALRTVLPVRQSVRSIEKKTIIRTMNQEEIASLLGEAMRKKQSGKVRLLTELQHEEQLPYELVTGKLHVSPATLRSLISLQAIRVETVSVYRNPVSFTEETEEKKVLSDEQSYIVSNILNGWKSGDGRPCLIHGITGSGKTEVYLKLIEQTVQEGKQCIMLIPEIALSYQTLLRFYKRFGDRVSVIHSGLSKGERYDQCERARNGEIDVIIGPRSALFVPFPNLGLILMDEEHEPSYKSETMPRYHARETAVFLAEQKNALFVMGSATPSLEAYSRALDGTYRLYTLTKRLTGGALADVEVVDLRKELKEGNRSIFSRRLQELMQEKLANGEQAMLFLNRRGYAGFVSCRSCGLVMKCPHCDVSLSKHRGGRLICHYCGYETMEPKKCPSCGSPYILGFKAGTQQIEEQILKYFPAARVLRMDADTTRKKGSYEEILSSFAEGEADILIGTQMIVKGHDFPNVTLMGVLAADLSLNDSDYRCGERTFQLLTQAAGRAGRGRKKGNVIIQTYQPTHYSIVHAASQDYQGFYEEEILCRQLLGYPPAQHMLAVLVTSDTEEDGRKAAAGLAKLLKTNEEQKKEQKNRAAIIGPAAAPIAKLSDKYRFVLYCKQSSYETLIACKEIIEQAEKKSPLKGISIQFDFDPVDGF